jgi:hypothetical protein
MKNSFYLVIPRQQDEPKRLKEFEAKSLRQWLDELPTANLGLATRLIHDFVLELNTISMPSQLRLDVLEKIKPNVHIIEDYLQSRLTKTGFPKDENEKKIFDVLVSIQKACAIGYWTVLKEHTHRDVSWFKGHNTTLPIQRCIKKLGRIVTNHFIMRAPVPDWVWIDIHALFKLNLKINYNTAKIVRHIKQQATTYTTEACYKQILLMSLADSSGLTQKEIPVVYDFIESISHLASIKGVPVLGQSRQCLILTDEDKPPYFQGEVDVEGDSSILYLDFSRLYHFLNQQTKQPNQFDIKLLGLKFGINHQVTKPPEELLHYLQQRWFGIELQGTALFVDRLDRCIVIGLSLTFDLKNASNMDENDGEIAERKEDFLAQSASDRLLSAVFTEPGVLSVGSLVSFRKQDEAESNRCLGIVNKMGVVSTAGKMVFGVQLLAARFYAVVCRQRHTTDEDNLQKGVFYSAKDLAGEKHYVITDYFMFEDNEVIDLSMGREDFPVMMKSRKNIGLGYWRFECQRIVEQARVEPIKKGYDFI